MVLIVAFHPSLRAARDASATVAGLISIFRPDLAGRQSRDAVFDVPNTVNGKRFGLPPLNRHARPIGLHLVDAERVASTDPRHHCINGHAPVWHDGAALQGIGTILRAGWLPISRQGFGILACRSGLGRRCHRIGDGRAFVHRPGRSAGGHSQVPCVALYIACRLAAPLAPSP
jgi:hypothetical protein